MATILIVDDRSINRQFLTSLLGYQQHQLREARDGAEGLRMVRELHPDLVICDVLMPTMDGYEFVRQLRMDPEIGNTRVIFSTAHFLSRESEALAKSCGVHSVINKPCEPAEVLRIVTQQLAAEPAATVEEPQTEEFDRQLRDANAKLTALIDVSTELQQERNPEQLLDRYCSVAREVIGARWSMLALMDNTQTAILHLGITGLELDDSPRLRGALLASEIFATVMREGRLISLSIETSAPEALRLPSDLPRADSLLVIPLITHGRNYGWICLGEKLGIDVFPESDERLATALAAKVAVAYDNARLLNESVKYAGDLETEIAERKIVERRLSGSEARMAAIINAAMDSIITVDSDQCVIMFNRAAEQMFQRCSNEVIGQPLSGFIPERFRARHSDDIRGFGETGVKSRAMAATRAVSALRADGTEFPVEASISQIEIDGQKLYTVIMRDITQRELTERDLKEANRLLEQTLGELSVKRDELAGMMQQLWQASKLATMGELAASIAHELNNPLATIMLSVEMLMLRLTGDDVKLNTLSVVRSETERMAALVSNLLQFSRRSQAQVSTLNIDEELNMTLDLIGFHLRGRRVDVVKDFASDVPTVQADRQQLRQVFLNLLTNASDAMSGGGTLTLRTRLSKLGDDEQSAASIEFIDTGTGINADDVSKIWEPFFTTKAEGKGTGLGLPICRRTIEEHRGTIQVESTCGQGTTFRILLPATGTATPLKK